MKKIIAISLSALISLKTFCCSGFVFNQNGKLYLCANLDMEAMHGYLLVNKRNIEKSSFFSNQLNVLKWISKYGSVTFSTIGKDFPFGGMNEVGLSVAVMTTPPMEYPNTDSRFEINEFQWILYILDNCSSTKEVIDSDSIIRINKFFDNQHYLICDSTGDIAIIEFRNGLRKVYHGSEIEIPVLENSFYEISVNNYKNGKSRNKIFDRFGQAAYLLENLNFTKINIDDPMSMFSILDNFKQNITRWQMVYDIKSGKVLYRENTYSYLVKPGSTGFLWTGSLNGSIDLKKTDFTGQTLARKIGIVYVKSNSSSVKSPHKISYPDKTLDTFSRVFDPELLKFNVDIFRSQGAKNITKDVVDKYVQFARSDDNIIK